MACQTVRAWERSTGLERKYAPGVAASMAISAVAEQDEVLDDIACC